VDLLGGSGEVLIGGSGGDGIGEDAVLGAGAGSGGSVGDEILEKKSYVELYPLETGRDKMLGPLVKPQSNWYEKWFS